MSQQMERIAVVCKWMGWKRVRRGGGECWEHKSTVSKDRKISVYDPVSTYDPWKYRDDLHDVLVHALRTEVVGSLCAKWAEKKDLAGSMVRFAVAKPDEVMNELWPHVERAVGANKSS